MAYLSGAWVPAETAALPVTDLGVVGGIAVAEMLRTFRHQAFRVTEHLQRLETSMALTGLPPRESLSEIQSILLRVVETNTATIAADDDLGVIVFVTGGANPTYVGRASAQKQGCTVGVHTFPLHFENWAAAYETGVRLALSPIPTVPSMIVDRRIKARSRLPWHLADRATRAIDPQAIALLADEAGMVTETAAANLCMVRGSVVSSPPIGTALEGVSLQVVLEFARELGYTIQRRPIPADELSEADELWLTTTPSCLLPVCWWQGNPIGTGRPGPIFRQIIDLWSQRVQLDIMGQARSIAAFPRGERP
ncbi:hypothetical protein GC163_03365 [bacterium]|nr:hypothetical protein [bacterium]